MALRAGTRLGPSEIVAGLGAGGMGEVYQARETRLDRTVAIKILRPESSAAPERRARFECEMTVDVRVAPSLAVGRPSPLFEYSDDLGLG